MENRQVQAAVLVMALAAASGPAVAAGSGFYFGVNAGRSDFDASAADVVGPPVLVANVFVSRTETSPVLFVPGALVPAAFIAPSMVSNGFDERDTSWSATAGYTLNRYLSFELSYADLGELRASQTSTFPIGATPQLQFRMSQELSVETVAFSALATLPLTERWSLFARGGYALSESEVTVGFSFVNATMAPSMSRVSMDFDSDDFTVGAGVGFELSSHWSLRADYDRIFDAGSSPSGSDVDIDTIGLTAIYRL